MEVVAHYVYQQNGRVRVGAWASEQNYHGHDNLERDSPYIQGPGYMRHVYESL